MRIGAIHDVIAHRLACAVRPVDHFFGAPVAELLEVSLAGTDARPTRSSAGGARHADGTYRFVDLPAGTYDVAVRSPSAMWMSLAPVTVSVPAASAIPVDVPLWPTPEFGGVTGFTSIRAVLTGGSVAALRVEIGSATTGFTGHFTRSRADGELVYIVPRAVRPTDAGVHDLRVQVEGGARSVVSVSIGGGAPVAGDTFSVPAGRTSRVAIQLAP